jgi:anaerobic selenocysteine-containing dehydrogenase
MCGLIVTHDQKKVIKIKGNPDDTFSRGYHCIKAESLADIYEDEDRIRHPMKRTGTEWTRISWEQAFSETIEGIKKIAKVHGKQSMGAYIGNPASHDYGLLLFLPGFLRSLQTTNMFSATSLDQLPHHMVGYQLFGHQMLIPIPDIDRTDYLLILGANPVVSRGSIMTAPDVKERLLDIGRRGGKVVLVDPRKTETAAIASQYVEIRPGGDAAFLAGLISIIFREKLDDPGHLAEVYTDYAELKSSFADWDLAAIERLTGIPVGSMESIARDFAAAPTAVCYGRLGVSAQIFGATCQWLITVLNAITGNLDQPGGAMFTLPAFDNLKHSAPGRFNNRKSRVRGLPAFGGEFPSATLADEILTEGNGQIKGLITVAGNPALSTPNGSRLERGLGQLEFMVSIDFYLNETTRHANIILPPISPLERSNYDVIFNLFSVRNTAAFSSRLFSPPVESKDSWEILLELETRLRGKNFIGKAKYSAVKAVRKTLGPKGLTALAIRFGPYGDGKSLSFAGLSLRKIEKSVSGIDLGPLKSQLPQRLRTKEKKISLMGTIYKGDLSRIRQELQGARDNRMLLIGRRGLRTNNSWSHNSKLLARGPSNCHALMNKQDLKALGINSGDEILVRSRVGSITIKVVGVDTIMRGVVSIPHGYGHDRPGTKLRNASLNPGVSVNDITDEKLIDALSGNAALNGVPVEVLLAKSGSTLAERKAGQADF